MPDELKVEDPDDATPTPAPAAPAAPVVNNDMIQMTPQQFEQHKQRYRKALQKELTDAKSQLAEYGTLQGQVQELLDSGLLPENAEFDDFKDATSKTLEGLMSDKQKAEKAQSATAEKLTKAEKLAESRWEKFKRARVFTEVAIEGKDKARGAGALRVMQKELLPFADVADDADGTVTFNMNVTDENGHTESKDVNAKRAIELMEENVSEWGFLFNIAVNGGGGGEITIDGIPRRGPKGKVDINKLTMEQFLELEQKNPQALEEALTLDAAQPVNMRPMATTVPPAMANDQLAGLAAMDSDEMILVTPYR